MVAYPITENEVSPVALVTLAEGVRELMTVDVWLKYPEGLEAVLIAVCCHHIDCLKFELGLSRCDIFMLPSESLTLDSLSAHDSLVYPNDSPLVRNCLLH